MYKVVHNPKMESFQLCMPSAKEDHNNSVFHSSLKPNAAARSVALGPKTFG